MPDTQQKIGEARRLKQEGKSYREIGDILGVGKTTVERWVDDK